MALHIFTDGASRGNPGHAGLGVALFEDSNLKEEIFEYLGKKTNNEAEYLAVVKALERVHSLGEKKCNLFSDSEFLTKQLKGEYKVKAEKIVPLYNKVQELLTGLDVTFHWVPREENKVADSLANKGIDEGSKDGLMKLEKAFFGKINCLKIQVNTQNEVYFHMGILDSASKSWSWEKVKMSDVEIGEIIHVLRKEEGKCSFYHSFNTKKTQIWCNKSPSSFSIKIKDVSKNLSIGEFEVLRILLEESVRLRNFN